MNLLERQPSADGGVKYLWGMPDAKRSVESIFFMLGGGKHVCISTQIGCPVGCIFCETGRQKTLGNLSASEIHAQVVAATKEHGRLKRVVVAGMGEPLLNLKAVGDAARQVLHEDLADEITITTSGIVPEMPGLDDVPLHLLSVSLHATTNETRTRLIPTNRKYPLEDVIAQATAYRERTGVPVMMIYLLFDGINDSDEDLERLLKLLDPSLFSVKLKEWNEIEDSVVRMAPSTRFDIFVDGLAAGGFAVGVDRSAGVDVGGGCGQLHSKVRNMRPVTAR
jgi:23S rRNA (adenine2503-C2)-methyltransferase